MLANGRREAQYRRALRTLFGRPLTTRDGVAEQRLRRTEKRLGIVLPAAVRDYYLVAGAATENHEHNRLFTPEELFVEENRLLFMEENQAVVHWGVPLRSRKSADPEVWQRVNGDDAEWHSEQLRFSVFILENLAWQRGVELSKGKIRRTSRA